MYDQIDAHPHVVDETPVLLNCVGMDDGWILGRYTMDTGQILRRIIHGISMLYLYVAQAPRISIHNPQVIYTICA